MSRDATIITVAHDATCDAMTLDPAMTGRLLHRRGVDIIPTTCAFHFRRVHCHAKKEAVIVATTTDHAINTMIAEIEDRKSDRNDHHVKATAVTSAKPHFVSRLRGASRSLNAVRLPRQF